MELEDATLYTEKCFRGEAASCSFVCPFGLDVRSFLEKAGRGRWSAAYKLLRNALVFPAVANALCAAPCEAHCQRLIIGDEAVAVRGTEAACIAFAKNKKPEAYAIPAKDGRVAIVGAGTAGLSCALALAQKKYRVTVFEREAVLGGHINADARAETFREEIRLMLSAEDIAFRFETRITDTGPLLREFDAVYIATGRGGDDFGLLEAWDPTLFTTEADKVFLGGMLCGMSPAEGMAAGVRAGAILESFLQTGRAALFDAYDKARCEHILRHDGAPSVPRVTAAADAYTEDEARREAARCLGCDCGRCLSDCEMLGLFRKDPHKIAVEAYTDTKANPPFATCSLTRQTYSCNVCGHCKAVCPEGADVGALLQRVRAARREAGTHIPVHDFWMREMEFYGGEAAFYSPPEGNSARAHIFFPGCRLGASNPEHVFRAYDFLRKEYAAGIFQSCCGAPAYWAGEDAALRDLTERLRAVWNGTGRPIFVFACAYCGRMFDLFLPEIQKISLYELLSRADVPHFATFDRMAVFDPCAARGDDRIQAGARAVAAKAGVGLCELPEKNRCCGYGGHMRTANPELYDRIAENRAAKSELPYLVYCANCRDVFAEKGKDCAHALDLAFGLPVLTKEPNLQQKRDNALLIKRALARPGENAGPLPRAWDGVKLARSEALAAETDRKLILEDDLKEAIWLAERTGEKFTDESDGMCQCCLVRPTVTYWVRYRKAGGEPDAAYEVFDAYCHRMRFDAGD
ncbi:MAG: FAD-dependent oxidoreductase [Clostridiales Family XIII bacterium]|jgi:Fe-S oxidoreductase|nr:FAD-dependent oxidoreductase [Clostridiales Family XIII bacterium]